MLLQFFLRPHKNPGDRFYPATTKQLQDSRTSDKLNARCTCTTSGWSWSPISDFVDWVIQQGQQGFQWGKHCGGYSLFTSLNWCDLWFFFFWRRKKQIQLCGLLTFSALAIPCWFDVGILLLFSLFKSRIHQMWQPDNPGNEDLHSCAAQDRGHCCLLQGCTQAQTANVTLENNTVMRNCYQRTPSGWQQWGGGWRGSSPSSAHVNLSKSNSCEWQKVALRQSKQMY